MPWVPEEYVKAYQLKITLRDVKPPVWRRVLVSGAVRLSFLSDVILIAMGWNNSHLHRFEIGGNAYEPPESLADAVGWGEESVAGNEEETFLAEALGGRKKFRYEYDFGDGWEHDVLVEKILPLEENLPLPRCVDGARACPPDDVGGPWGYAEFLEAMADPRHPDHEDRVDWIGGAFDPEAFSVEAVNKLLFKALPKEYRTQLKQPKPAKPAESKPEKVTRVKWVLAPTSKTSPKPSVEAAAKTPERTPAKPRRARRAPRKPASE